MVDGPYRKPQENDEEGNLITALFLLERTLRSHGASHPLARQIARRFAESIFSTGLPFSLQFVGGAVFRDMKLLPVSLKTYKQVREISGCLRNLSVDELSFDNVPGLTELLRFGEAMASGSASTSDALDLLSINGLSWREIEGVRWGLEMEDVDPDIYTATQIAIAVADAERLALSLDGPWDWAKGIGIVRRIERAFRISPAATERSLEVIPEGWSVARRAVSAAHRTLVALNTVGVNRGICRATSHAILALAIQGLRKRGGNMIVPSAKALLPRLITSKGFTRTGIEPHRLRVDALVHRLLPEFAEQRKTPSIIHLVLISYELERRRCPPGTDFDLTSGDLLALAAQEAGVRYHAGFVRLLVETAGRIPVGAHVRLEDGRTGVVLLTNPNKPLYPKVLVGSQVMTPTAPVALVSLVQP